MDRRDVLRCAGVGLAGLMLEPHWLSGFGAMGGEGKSNLLFIVVDDLRCELGCYGQQHIHSPNIDALAANGCCFQQAHVQQAVCAASRASFLTGCRPDTTGVDYPYTKWFEQEFLPSHPSLPRYLTQHGLYCEGHGKLHHGPPYDLHQLSFPYNGGGDQGLHYALPENQGLKGKQRPPCEIADVADEVYIDGATTTRVVAGLKRAKASGQRFAMSVGFSKPHLPFNAPKRYWDLYDPEAIALSPAPDLPEGAPFYAPATYELPAYNCHDKLQAVPKDGTRSITDEALARQLRHGYFACVSFIDAQVGRLMAELDELGLRDDTLVVLCSDHGWHLGDQGCWGKHTTYEVATRSPLILSGAGVPAAGDCQALVEYVDIFPSVCDLMGLPAPAYLEGTSLLPLLSDPTRHWKPAVFSQFHRYDMLEAYAMRTERYRYVEWRYRQEKPGHSYWTGKLGEVHMRELYDHQVDPHEQHNIVKQHDELAAQLSKQLAAGWRSALPPGCENHSANPPAPNVTFVLQH